jgi:hypothetical protein
MALGGSSCHTRVRLAVAELYKMYACVSADCGMVHCLLDVCVWSEFHAKGVYSSSLNLGIF